MAASAPRRWLVGLGSNQGDRRALLRAALCRLVEGGCRLLQASGLWATEPLGNPPAPLPDDEPAGNPPAPLPGDEPSGSAAVPEFLNAVVELETGLDPWALLRLVQDVEAALGRERAAPRNAPRPIDIDLLAARGLILCSARLSLPHPRLAGRGFVLRPLAELVDVDGYGLGGSVGRGRVRRIEGPGWVEEGLYADRSHAR